ncbi:MAG: hypothetical protein HQL15_05525 [Candidatus Omnitrophica bacterium]|nr:hypothetical protein [Candidatus Omnitrophota bacterium]
MESLQDHWGRIQEEDTAVMPFHKRNGEGNFIPLNTSENQIKRYTYDVKFEHAEINFDLTLVSDGTQYKIVWISLWGSSIYMTPEITTKIEELFSNPENSQK